jgi:hypothetical protein
MVARHVHGAEIARLNRIQRAQPQVRVVEVRDARSIR